MQDVVLVGVAIGFFVLAALFVRACASIIGEPTRRDGRPVSVDNAIGLVLAVAALGYLVYALLYPERL